MNIMLVAAALLMVGAGILGAVLPALPGAPLVFGGLLLLAWLDEFTRVSALTIWILAALTVLSIVVDFLAGTLGASRVGASKLAIAGAILGTIFGIFMGIVGVFILPFVGAVIGEYLERRDVSRAGRVGFGTWLGIMLGLAAKLSIIFMMIGLFVVAYAT